MGRLVEAGRVRASESDFIMANAGPLFTDTAG